jgi:hypothetical protein
MFTLEARARLGLALFLLFASGCAPRIGDDCTTNTNCTGQTERLCDNSQPGGYCTLFGCNPTSCPADESVCVSFGAAASPVEGCSSPDLTAPAAKAFCMKWCNQDSDCRPEYACVDVGGDDPWGATVVQRAPSSTKICIAPESSAPIPPDRSNEVCIGPSDEASGGGAGGGGGSNTAGASR